MLKRFYVEKIGHRFWILFFAGMILVSVVGGIVAKEIIGNSSIRYYINYICWFTLWLTYIKKEKKKDYGREYIIFFCIILFNSVLGALFGRAVLDLRMDNFHQGFLMGLAILTVMGIDWNEHMSEEDFFFIMKVIFGIGIVASIYAMIFQNHNFIGVLRGIEQNNNAWRYRSFFGQRNIFAYFCFLSSVAGKYLFDICRQKRYLLGLLLLALQIYVTDSRTAILVLLIFYVMDIFLRFNKKNKVQMLILVACVAICVFSFIDLDLLMNRFYHESNTSYGDSGTLRMNMWYSGIDFLITKKAIFTGFGFGSEAAYLPSIFGLESFHNAYMDILFQGGIILLGIHLYMIRKVFRNIKIVDNPQNKSISLSFVAAYMVGCFFDSSAMLFSSNYEGIIATLMICILTKIRINEIKILKL